MIPRLHVNAPLGADLSAPLTPEQAHYLFDVLRRAPGDVVRVFNARDGEFAATIERVGKSGAVARLAERARAPAAEPDVWLLFAAVKRDAMDLIARQATELGVSALIPVVTARTNVARVKVHRLAAIAIEAAEQCGRLSSPDVRPLQELSSFLDAWPSGRRLIYCDEAGDDQHLPWGGERGRARPMLDAMTGGEAVSLAILIGPEGGFAPAERTRLRSLPFVTPVSLGPRILRADTAAIVALALWQAAIGDFGGLTSALLTER